MSCVYTCFAFLFFCDWTFWPHDCPPTHDLCDTGAKLCQRYLSRHSWSWGPRQQGVHPGLVLLPTLSPPQRGKILLNTAGCLALWNSGSGTRVLSREAGNNHRSLIKDEVKDEISIYRNKLWKKIVQNSFCKVMVKQVCVFIFIFFYTMTSSWSLYREGEGSGRAGTGWWGSQGCTEVTP